LVLPTGVKGGGALAPVPRTGTKGWAFSLGRAAPAREPGQQTFLTGANARTCGSVCNSTMTMLHPSQAHFDSEDDPLLAWDL